MATTRKTPAQRIAESRDRIAEFDQMAGRGPVPSPEDDLELVRELYSDAFDHYWRQTDVEDTDDMDEAYPHDPVQQCKEFGIGKPDSEKTFEELLGGLLFVCSYLEGGEGYDWECESGRTAADVKREAEAMAGRRGVRVPPRR